MSQQVSVASANAIWKRLEAAQLTNPRAIAAATEEALRACGLSRQKIAYAYGLANSGLDYDALRELADEDVIAKLVALPELGVGLQKCMRFPHLAGQMFLLREILHCRRQLGRCSRWKSDPVNGNCASSPKAGRHGERLRPGLSGAYYRVTKEREGTR